MIWLLVGCAWLALVGWICLFVYAARRLRELENDDE